MLMTLGKTASKYSIKKNIKIHIIVILVRVWAVLSHQEMTRKICVKKWGWRLVTHVAVNPDTSLPENPR